MTKINIRGVLFDNVDMCEAMEKAVEFINAPTASVIFTPNSEIVQFCVEDADMLSVINSADMIIPDGAGVVLASRILKTPLKGKVAGCELAEKIVEYCAANGKKMFFLGSKPEYTDENGNVVISTAEQAAINLANKYPGLDVCGTADGYFKDEESGKIIELINRSGADVVFVCLGCPRQEKWIHEHKNDTTAKLLIGLGGSLDVYAGRVNRAPDFFVKNNLEWFYRLVKQPQRLGRMMKIPKFLLQTMIRKNNI
ncbi:MAG: WecB/TagA/CpsF family glycosyltransferase [Ruminococcaceae bacterium]|nr:WecB/TagA/CpsF family glycosyltransferase [Oscillospiraceae bacterium]